MKVDEYAVWRTIAKRVEEIILENSPKHPDMWGREGETLIKEGWIQKSEKTRTKDRWSVWHHEHPQGLLKRKCPVCGFRFGIAWLKEALPPDVYEFLPAWA